MADHNLDDIAAGLNALHPFLSSQGFVDYGNSMSDVVGDPWSWDNLFHYMAWECLQHTEQFQIDIVDKGKKNIYGEYLEIVKMEKQSNKCN